MTGVAGVPACSRCDAVTPRAGMKLDSPTAGQPSLSKQPLYDAMTGMAAIDSSVVHSYTLRSRLQVTVDKSLLCLYINTHT